VKTLTIIYKSENALTYYQNFVVLEMSSLLTKVKK